MFLIYTPLILHLLSLDISYEPDILNNGWIFYELNPFYSYPSIKALFLTENLLSLIDPVVVITPSIDFLVPFNIKLSPIFLGNEIFDILILFNLMQLILFNILSEVIWITNIFNRTAGAGYTSTKKKFFVNLFNKIMFKNDYIRIFKRFKN